MEDSNLRKKVNSTLKDVGLIDLSMSEFKWKMPGLMKGIDANDAFREIERIKAKHGELTARIILAESRSPTAVFHRYFNWNDADAAEKYRLNQARDLINNIQVNIITDGEPREIAVYEVVSRTDRAGSFKSIEAMTSDDIEYVRQQVVKALTTYRNKLSVYDQFKLSVKHLDNAISELEILEPKKQVAA